MGAGSSRARAGKRYPGIENPTYGYKLVANFGDLFKSTPDYKFNQESIFEISYTNTSQGTWDCVACTEGNVLNIMTGPRSYTAKTADAPDYVSGWSFLTVTKELYAVMKDDPRFPYTIADLKALVAAERHRIPRGTTIPGISWRNSPAACLTACPAVSRN